MKNIIKMLIVLVVILLAAEPVNAQRDNSRVRPSPNAKVSQTIGTTEIDMHYSRPGVKDRTVFGELESWGAVWRAGANEPTTVTLSGDVQVEGQTLAAGTYSMFIRLVENGDWGVIFTEPVRWGTMYDEEKKILEVSVTPGTGSNQEWLLFTFENLTDSSATLILKWAEKVVPINITL